MRSPFKGVSNFQKFFISLTIIFVVAIIDYQVFLDKYKKVEVFDQLHSRITSARVSISKLEYLIDMFTVSRSFEGTTVDLIKGDVALLNDNITEIMENPEYRGVWKNDAILAEDMQSMSDDWATIKAEVKRLNDAMTPDEVILIHNAVDMNTVLANEKAERLLAVISARRHAIFNDTKSLALGSIIAFVLLMLFASLVYYKKVVSPVAKASDVARRFVAGDRGARFRDGGGALGVLGAELNNMTEAVDKTLRLKDFECAGLQGALHEKSVQVGALISIMSFAGRSLAQSEVFGFAVGEAVLAAGADTGAIYALEDGGLKLKAHSGLIGSFSAQAGTLASMPADRSLVIEDIDSLEEPLRGVLKSTGASIAAIVPLVYNSVPTGILLAAYRDPAKFNLQHFRFFEAVAASISVASGHSGLFQKEHSTRKFFERLLVQLPVGLAVFAAGGRCVLMSAQARRALGVDPAMEASSYCVFDDAELASQGAITYVRRSYEGYSSEFIVNYSPMSGRALGLTMEPVRLRVKSFPLYDSGGEVSNVALLYENLSEAGTAGNRAS
ncbi:MAG: GAF domain-containing protein [Deltaproteobacteria bacterium]|nr:GAF domain-containing protein [Deltaproteobacteria bacterium]